MKPVFMVISMMATTGCGGVNLSTPASVVCFNNDGKIIYKDDVVNYYRPYQGSSWGFYTKSGAVHVTGTCVVVDK